MNPALSVAYILLKSLRQTGFIHPPTNTSNSSTLTSLRRRERAVGCIMRKIDTAWRETELHQTGSTLTPLDFKDFIPAAENPLSKASDGKPVGLEAGAVSKAKSGP